MRGRAGARTLRPAPTPMLRRALFDRPRRPDAEDAFRWRGQDVSRLENLSDIVFALAISLLMATADVPASFAELAETLQTFVPLAGCFALLLAVWQVHYTYFRRYGLSDGRTVALNAVLLFLVLLFVYPLRFLADFQAGILFGRYASGRELAAVVSFEQIPFLQLVYSGGYAAVFGVFALLYRHAARQADALALTPAERTLTAERVALASTHVAVALLAIALAFVLPRVWTPMSWMAYMLLWPALPVVRRRYRLRLEPPDRSETDD